MISAIIVAAGSGTRFGSDKLAIVLGGKPVWQWSVETFLNHPEIDEVIVVGERDYPDVKWVPGGASRTESVANGLRAVSSDSEFVLIHDAARPFVSPSIISHVISALKEGHRAVCPILPVTDTIRQNNTLISRAELQAMQTPQGGRLSDFLTALDQASPNFTDDISLLESLGHSLHGVQGDPKNLKLTTEDDLIRLRGYLNMELRTGLGYDIHAFSTDPNRPMILGGLEFDDRPGLEGHSDADALLHAIVDALLGAASLGDIGVHYPNTDPRWKDRPSLLFLTESANLLREKGWEVINIDATVIAERPKVNPVRQEMCAVIAEAAGIEADRVSVKATTNERLGTIGREEGIAAMAVATIRRT